MARFVRIILLLIVGSLSAVCAVSHAAEAPLRELAQALARDPATGTRADTMLTKFPRVSAVVARSVLTQRLAVGFTAPRLEP